MKLMTIRELAARAGVSRATLLYYEAAGLLLPARRSSSGYRLYGAGELERLESIRAFRNAGMAVSVIGDILGSRPSTSMQLLEARLFDLDREIQVLREQQITLARLLAQASLDSPGKIGSKEAWVGLMRKAGLSDADMRRWHAIFEADAPDSHKEFLASLGLSSSEVAAIRSWAREGA